MKVYIACLAAYNSGILYGEWIEPSSDVEELSEQIKAILKKSPAPDAEEWAFHDYDDFPNMGECPNLEDVCKWIELVEEYSHHKEYLNAIYDNFRSIEDTETSLENGFSGYESFEQYANERADEDIACIVSRLGDNVFIEQAQKKHDESFIVQYFDYDKHKEALSYSYDVYDHPSKPEVFIAPNH